ncbi:MAG: hypothetical protein SBU_000578 [Candidatus Syntrophoarchaeum butanivorans]|uniref:Uncharacterized protein n=1 Tax=Candidatus Syntropharchaeum butanivorans TaxID=1839936 RepID=A0A1F2P7E5_9EURY|nr:MAG: hypothetical protein SBU_000578 [Candidatus Syntrophoarchaeum butanivorans]
MEYSKKIPLCAIVAIIYEISKQYRLTQLAKMRYTSSEK